MINNEKAPINFYGAHLETPISTNLEAITPQINFAEEIQIRLPTKD
jgi:hypothetical protein